MTKTGSGRWRTWLLVGSLALNLLVIGSLAGIALKGGPAGPVNSRGGPEGLRMMFQALPETQRDTLRAQFRARETDFRSTRREFGRIRSAMLEVLARDPFDQAAFSALMDEQSNMMRRTTREGQSIFLQVIEDMSPAERQQFAENLRKPRHRRK